MLRSAWQKNIVFWTTSQSDSEECISSILPTKLTTTNPSASEQTVQNLLASTHNCRRYSSTGNSPLPIQLCNFPSPFLWFEPPFEATMVSATNINLNIKYIIYPSNKCVIQTSILIRGDLRRGASPFSGNCRYNWRRVVVTTIFSRHLQGMTSHFRIGRYRLKISNAFNLYSEWYP